MCTIFIQGGISKIFHRKTHIKIKYRPFLDKRVYKPGNLARMHGYGGISTYNTFCIIDGMDANKKNK